MRYPTTVLEVKELVCTQAQRPLFKPLSFSVTNNQIVLLQGPNGIGKTTCLRTLAGLVAPEQGDILWQAQPLKPYAYLNQMIYLGHHPGIKLALTPEENIKQYLYLSNREVEPQRIKSVLEQVGLHTISHKICATLSAGQQRRVNWARLLLAEAPLWILDEPLTALDKEGILGIQQALQYHQEQGGSVILTSHQSLPIATHQVVLEAWS
jgi:heme exporter protein A